MDKLRLDNYCEYIFVALGFQDCQQFNQLHRYLKNNNLQMSKPTLSDHLKHLVKSGIVNRKENEGKQSVTYSLNPEKIGTSKEFFKQMKETIRDERKNKKKFFDYPEKEQVQIVLKELIGRKLNEIKAYVDYRLNPTFDKQLAFMFWT